MRLVALQYNVYNMDDSVGGDVVSLYDVPHGEAARDCHLPRELGQGQPLPGPCDERCAALGEPGGGKTTFGHVSQQSQLQLLWI